jgi:hypothetical protein
MQNRPLKFLALVALLSGLAGCTDSDWDHALSYAGVGNKQVAEAAPVEAAPQPAPAAATPAPDTSFCQAVAMQDANGDGFDTATRQRMLRRSFEQCMAMFGTPR